MVKQMPWNTFLSTSLPCGIVTAADIGLSNLSLVRVSISFYTMVKASAPIFVVMSAFVFGLEPITCGLILVVLVISAGECLTVLGEGISFDATGLFLVLSASMCGGLRWTLVQLKIKNLDPPLKTAIATMRVLSPSMFFVLIFTSLIIEDWNVLGPFLDSWHMVGVTLALALGGASMAIAMVLCELSLIMKSSAIVLMIGGVLKEILTIMMGVIIFQDQLNPINVAGFFVVFLGVILYKILFHLSKMEKRNSDVNLVKDLVFDIDETHLESDPIVSDAVESDLNGYAKLEELQVCESIPGRSSLVGVSLHDAPTVVQAVNGLIGCRDLRTSPRQRKDYGEVNRLEEKEEQIDLSPIL